MSTPYTPIDCGLYSRYELAILRGRRLRLTWADADGVTHVETCRPHDLVTRAHVEYLRFRDADGREREVRLDRIQAVDGLE